MWPSWTLTWKEVGSCPSPSDSPYLYVPECVCVRVLGCRTTVYLSHQHGSEQPLGRPQLGMGGSASPGGGDLISRQPLLPYSSGVLLAFPVTCIATA